MSALPLTLVLVAAFIHAGWNLVAKKAGGDIRFVLLTFVALAIVWAPVGIWFSWRQVGDFGPLQWALIATSGVIHLVYFLTLLRGYRKGDLSIVYPVARGTGPLLTALVATGLFGESLRLLGWLGVLGIVVGIVLIAGGPGLIQVFRRDTRSDLVHQRVRAGVLYGLLTGLFIAAYTVVDGYAVKRAGISPVLVDYLGNLARLPLGIVVLLVARRREELPMRGYIRRMWRPALLVGAISPVAYVIVLYAATMAPLSQVAPAREVSMLFAALFGGHLLGERDAGIRLLGAGCIVAGVVALIV